jgi:hypothetical protein
MQSKQYINDIISKLNPKPKDTDKRYRYKKIKIVLMFSIFYDMVSNFKNTNMFREMTQIIQQTDVSMWEKIARLNILGQLNRDKKELSLVKIISNIKETQKLQNIYDDLNPSKSEINETTNSINMSRLLTNIYGGVAPESIMLMPKSAAESKVPNIPPNAGKKFIEIPDSKIYEKFNEKPSITYLQLISQIDINFINNFIKNNKEIASEIVDNISDANMNEMKIFFCNFIRLDTVFYFYYLNFKILHSICITIHAVKDKSNKSNLPEIIKAAASKIEHDFPYYSKSIGMADNFCLSLDILFQRCPETLDTTQKKNRSELLVLVHRIKMSVQQHISKLIKILKKTKIVDVIPLSKPEPSRHQTPEPSRLPTPEPSPRGILPVIPEQKDPVNYPDEDPVNYPDEDPVNYSDEDLCEDPDEDSYDNLYAWFFLIYITIGISEDEAQVLAFNLYKTYNKEKGFKLLELTIDVKRLFLKLLDADEKLAAFQNTNNLKDKKYWQEFIRIVGKLQALTTIEQIKKPETSNNERLEHIIKLLNHKLELINEVTISSLKQL